MLKRIKIQGYKSLVDVDVELQPLTVLFGPNCERNLYKRLLLEAVRQTGINPPLGGLEYAEELVKAMDLEHLERNEESLGKLLKSLRQQFQAWQRTRP